MKRWTSASIFNLILILLLQSPLAASAKKNVCTIAINSDDEINLFKKYLSPNDYNFIDLVPNERMDMTTHPEKWFFDDCDKKISCDTLIVSAHFAGTFFGLLRSYRLSLETLEKVSCDTRCDGILKNPKEVFLFGCNTLAGKDSDGRTPEQYRSDLIHIEHMPPEYVEQMVAFKASPIGISYGDRIRRVFNNVPFIYGFDSKAPLGPDMAGPLAQYLKNAGPRYNQIWDSNDPKRHQPLLDLINMIPGKKMIQEPGLKLKPGEKIPACFLNDPQISVATKLNWIDQSLASDERLEYIPDVGDFLSGKKNYQWSSEEDSILNHIGVNTQAKNDVVDFLKAPMNGFLGVQIKMLNLARQLNWISAEVFESTLHNLVIGDLRKPVSTDRLDSVCSLNLTVFPTLTFAEIPDASWHQENFVSLSGCLAVKDSQIQSRLLTTALQGRGALQTAATGALAKLPNLSADQILYLVPLLNDSSSDPDVRINALKAIGKLNSVSDDLIQLILDVFLKDPSSEVAQQAADTLNKINISGNPAIIQQIENVATTLTRDPMRTAYAIRILKRLPHPDQYLSYFEQGFDSPNVSVQSEALQAAALSGVNDANLQLIIVNKFRSTLEFRIMLSSYSALGAMPLQNPEVLYALISVIGRVNVAGESDKKASLATTLLVNRPLTAEMMQTLKNLLADEKNDEVNFRLKKLLKL